MLTNLQNRGIKDILIACIDNLNGFWQAVGTVFLQTEIQICVVHQIRNSLKYVSSKDQKAFMNDPQPVFQAETLELAGTALRSAERKVEQEVRNGAGILAQ